MRAEYGCRARVEETATVGAEEEEEGAVETGGERTERGVQLTTMSASHHITSHHITSHHTTSHHITLHHTTSHDTTWHDTTWHDTT